MLISRRYASNANRASRPLIYQALPNNLTVRYQFFYADFWGSNGQEYCCRDGACKRFYPVAHWYEFLSAARQDTKVLFDIFTAGLRVAGASYANVGPARTYLASQNFAKVFNH